MSASCSEMCLLQDQGWGCHQPLEQGLCRGGCEPWGGSQQLFCWPGHHPLLLRELSEEQRAGTGCFPSPGNALLCSARSSINKITATVTLLIALALTGLAKFPPAHYLIQCKRVISGTCRAPWKPPQVSHECTARGQSPHCELHRQRAEGHEERTRKHKGPTAACLCFFIYVWCRKGSDLRNNFWGGRSSGDGRIGCLSDEWTVT